MMEVDACSDEARTAFVREEGSSEEAECLICHQEGRRRKMTTRSVTDKSDRKC